MLKRQSKEVYAAIDDFISRRAVIDSKELTEFVSTVADPPEYGEMTSDYYNKIANSRIKRIHDEDGTRCIFSNGDKINPKYVNVNKAVRKDLPDLLKAHAVQTRNKEKLEANIEKLQKRMKILAGQISIDEFLSSTEVQKTQEIKELAYV